MKLNGISITDATIEAIIKDPAQFQKWWNRREPRSLDRALIRAAIDAGLVVRVGKGVLAMLFLTAAGKAHRPPRAPRKPRLAN